MGLRLYSSTVVFLVLYDCGVCDCLSGVVRLSFWCCTIVFLVLYDCSFWCCTIVFLVLYDCRSGVCDRLSSVCDRDMLSDTEQI